MVSSELNSLAEQAIRHARQLKIDYADVRVQSGEMLNLLRENKILREACEGDIFGIGVRVLHNGKWGFFSANSKDVRKIVGAALKLAKLNPKKDRVVLKEAPIIKDKYKVGDGSISRWAVGDKIDFVKAIEGSARLDKRIKTVRVRYGDGAVQEVLASTEGSFIQHSLESVYAGIAITAKSGKEIESAYEAKSGFEKRRLLKLPGLAGELAGVAIKLLSARKAPAGKFPVLLDPNATGLFAHEAVGHASEADLVLAGESILKNKIGKKVASDAVTLVDDGSLLEWGYHKYDDEGVKSRRVEIIRNGILKSYLHSRESAEKLNQELTGSARGQAYNFPPIVRMSNTFLENGDYSFEDLLEEIRNGYYLAGKGAGGQVSPLEGTFVFAAERAYEIKNGRLGKMLKGCSFSGKTLETLHHIAALEKGRADFSEGFCGKGQRIPVGDGKCHMFVKELMIGGQG
jgi:TldD protein